MNDQAIAFYFDACVQVVIAEQLNHEGIEAITARDLKKLSDDDPSHLQRATEQQRVLVTHDDDFVKMAQRGVEHAGVVFVPTRYRKIGVVVKELRKFQAQYSRDDVSNLVWYLTDTSSE